MTGGHADLGPDGLPGLGARGREQSGVPVTGGARTPFRTATHAIPVRRGPSARPLRAWGVDTLVICGTVANICVHYTAASAALRWYNVVIPRDAVSALEPFDLESSLRQTDFLFAGRVTTAAAIRI